MVTTGGHVLFCMLLGADELHSLRNKKVGIAHRLSPTSLTITRKPEFALCPSTDFGNGNRCRQAFQDHTVVTTRVPNLDGPEYFSTLAR